MTSNLPPRRLYVDESKSAAAKPAPAKPVLAEPAIEEEAPLKRGEANAAARKEREADALRENLKKRKSQSRGRKPKA